MKRDGRFRISLGTKSMRSAVLREMVLISYCVAPGS